MVHMMQPDRKPYSGAQPAPEEARQALRTYTNYFGPFYIHEPTATSSTIRSAR